MQVFDRGLHGHGARPRRIQVIDAQDHPSAGMPRGEPRNQKRARMPEMKPARRRWSQPADGSRLFGLLVLSFALTVASQKSHAAATIHGSQPAKNRQALQLNAIRLCRDLHFC